MNKLAATMSVTLVVIVGCNNDDSGGPVVVAPSSVVAVDGADAVAWESGFFWVAAAPIDPAAAIDVDAIAASYARTIASSFEPTGCATASLSAHNVVELGLDDCSGPFGLRGARGTVVVTFGTGQAGAGVSIIANALTVAGGSLTINANAVLTSSGMARALAIHTNSGGVGPDGHSLARLGSYTVTWSDGETCVRIDGALIGAIDTKVQRSTFGSVDVCTVGCPRSGTLTVDTPANGTTLTTTYNGTPTVTVTSSTGQQGAVTLTCE